MTSAYTTNTLQVTCAPLTCCLGPSARTFATVIGPASGGFSRGKKATFWDTSSPLDAVHKISYPSGSLTYTNTQQILFPNTPHHNTYPFYNQIMKSYLLIVLFTFVSFTGFLVIMACSNNRRFSGINTTTRWYSSLPLCNVASK